MLSEHAGAGNHAVLDGAVLVGAGNDPLPDERAVVSCAVLSEHAGGVFVGAVVVCAGNRAADSVLSEHAGAVVFRELNRAVSAVLSELACSVVVFVVVFPSSARRWPVLVSRLVSLLSVLFEPLAGLSVRSP